MAVGGEAPQQQPQPQLPSTPSNSAHPKVTVPQLLGFAAFALFIVWALIAPTKKTVNVTGDELKQVRTLTLFVIGALLPSDAVIRFGRNLLFQTVDDPDTSASYAPATTFAQLLAFAVYVALVLLTLFSSTVIGAGEYSQLSEVGRTLIIALLPSDAAIRFGRALYFRGTPGSPTKAQMARV